MSTDPDELTDLQMLHLHQAKDAEIAQLRSDLAEVSHQFAQHLRQECRCHALLRRVASALGR